MRLLLVLLCLVGGVALGGTPKTPMVLLDNHGNEIQRYIVILKSNYDPEIFIRAHDLPKPERLWTTALKGFTIKVTPEITIETILDLKNEPEVDIVEKDAAVQLIEPVEDDPSEDEPGEDEPSEPGEEPTPPPPPAQPPQEKPYGIERTGSFNCKGTCRLKRAFVIDTGIDLDHPDLTVKENRGFTAFDDGSFDDDNGHGTHVAGTIGALDNDIGVIGVAAGAKLIPVKVLNARGSGSVSGVIAGINHVAKKGRRGDVANMSLGGSASEALDKAVINAAKEGIIFTLAAGNSGSDATNFSPARTNGKNIFTISAVDKNDTFAPFSNFGSVVDKAEPGVRVLSTYRDGGYRTLSGTSMAAPHAAGILLRRGFFEKGCEEAKGDPDDEPDCIGVLP